MAHTDETQEQARISCETHLISSLLKDKADVLYCVSSLGLSEKHFSAPKHKALFLALYAIATAPESNSNSLRETPLEQLFVLCVQQGQRPPFSSNELVAIDGLEPTAMNARRHCEHVITLSKRDETVRLLRKTAADIVTKHKAPSDWQSIWSDVAASLAPMNDIANDTKSKTLAEACDEWFYEQQNPLNARVTPIGIPIWDREAGSLREGELITLAGRPGTGKTALAIQTAYNVAQRGDTVAFFSLEMTSKELAGRLALHRAGPTGVGDHPASLAERLQSVQEIKKLRSLHVFEEKQSRTIAAIEARCRLLAASPAGLHLVVIDYLQLIAVSQDMKKQPREQQVADLSRRLKLLANDIKCPIILLAQINREAEKEQRPPRLSDLRESGAIEQDSDRVWFLYEHVDKEKPAQALTNASAIDIMIYQAKCRAGVPGIGSVFRFHRPCFRFTITKAA